jgi:membrane-anchored protein YejM (alkaline phosphatase superfamily)
VDRDDSVASVAIDELTSKDPRPFFLWVHFFEPHEPMGEAPGAPNFGSAFEDLYDRDVAYCDIELGRLLRAIDSLPAARPTAVIVASDHGELLTGGIQQHGVDLSLAAIRIVLVAKGPTLPAGVVGAPASLVDVAPTVLAWTRTPAPPWLDGRDLCTLPPDRVVLTDLWRHSFSGEKFIDETVALTDTDRVTYDILVGEKTLARADDPGRPPTPIAPPIPRALDAALGAYLERARPVP